jgi:hypothetical protein
MFMIAGASNSHEPGITVDGRPVGVQSRIFREQAQASMISQVWTWIPPFITSWILP